MQIHSKGTGALTPETHSAQRTENADKAPASAAAATPASIDRSDKVQISDAGRALAARETDRTVQAGLDPIRASHIRQRVLSGAYDSLSVVDTVARRLMNSGDL
jgi:negative regulator of flagellin synthesis FlgM